MTIPINLIGNSTPFGALPVDVIKKNSPDGTLQGVLNCIPTFHVPDMNVFNVQRYFFNSVYGDNMARNFTAGGGEGIHNGTDSVMWTASAISGTWNFASTTQAHSGTKSIDATATANNNVAQFTRPSGLLNLSGYTAMSGWIYKTATSTGTTIQGYNTITGSGVGSAININNYTTTQLNVWQKYTIPLTTMNLANQNINAIRIQTQGLQRYYLDDMQIDYAAGSYLGAQTFEVEQIPATWLLVHEIQFQMADQQYSGILQNSTMARLDYKSLLGVQPDIGINLTYTRRFKESNVVISIPYIIKNIAEMLTLPKAVIDHAMYHETQGTFLSITAHFDEPIILRKRAGTSLTVTLSDNFSQLEYFKMMTNCTFSACAEEIV